MLIIFGIMRPSEASAETKVRELDVTELINEDVVRFDVAVDEAHLVHAVHGTDQLADVEPEVLQLVTELSPRPEPTGTDSYLARGSSKIPFLIRSDMRSPPGMYSITK